MEPSKINSGPQESLFFFVGLFMSSIEQLSEEIQKLKVRNARVEQEKSWETSWQRHVSIVIATYIVMLILFLLLDDKTPFLNAGISTIGYLISVLSMNWVKKLFLRRQ